MKIPAARGELSAALREYLTDTDVRWLGLPTASDPDDAAIALWCLHELAYRGFDDVSDDMEWDPTLITVRARLERDLESRLRADFDLCAADTLPDLLTAYQDTAGIAHFVRRSATAGDVRDILIQKSIYHLKEADPHCFVLPRLEPATKAMLTELQYDELGAGVPERMHARLFADALTAAGLDSTYGAYIDHASLATLTFNNALSMLCLNRRLRHAALGHLAAFEATSSLPCADWVHGLRRLGFDETVVRYFDEHVEADAVHEQLARWICDQMTGDDTNLEREVGFGAFVCLELESRCAAAIMPTEVAA